jgi:thiol-disulfide isomerase/thioredoxin/uncharacterized membrane protein YphA (DoxX/SURF4 family)
MNLEKRNFLSNTWCLFAMRLILGGIFLVSSLSKLTDISSFQRLVASYHILPVGLAQVYGLLIPWIELIMAVLLITGIFRRIAAAGTIVLTASFATASIFSLVSGATATCGCFGEAFPLSHSQSLIINGFMLIQAVLLLVTPQTSPGIGRSFKRLAYWTMAIVIIGCTALPQPALAKAVTDKELAANSVQKANQAIEASLDAGKPAFLFFYSDGCAACQAQKPIIDNLEQEFAGQVTFMRFDYGQDKEVLNEYEVTSFPTLVLVSRENEEGSKIQRFEGVTDQNLLVTNITNTLNNLAYVKSSIKEILSSSSSSTQTEALILTVDGLDFNKTIPAFIIERINKPDIPLIDPLNLVSDGNKSQYLQPALMDTLIDLHKNIYFTSFPWSGNAENSEIILDNLEKYIISEYNSKIKDSNIPFIIVAHSWGCILTNWVLADLQKKYEYFVPDLYITLSNPLGSSDPVVWSYIKGWQLALWNLDNPSFPIAGRCLNFWSKGDAISGSIEGMENVEEPVVIYTGTLGLSLFDLLKLFVREKIQEKFPYYVTSRMHAYTTLKQNWDFGIINPLLLHQPEPTNNEGLRQEIRESISQEISRLQPSKIHPGGVWISPSNNVTATNSLHFAARAYPSKSSDPAIDHVNFTVKPQNGAWTMAAPNIESQGNDIFSADWIIPSNMSGQATVSFDVYDKEGNHTLSPNGMRNVTLKHLPDPNPEPDVCTYGDWGVGQRVLLKKGAEIREGSGNGYTIHTIVPEDGWAVDIIGGPRCINGVDWWDISRANLDGGGTGWIKRTQAQYISPDDPVVPQVCSYGDWNLGQRVALKNGAEIHTGNSDDSYITLRVPEDNWLVEIIDGPRCVNGEDWWDISRVKLDNGGTGWVKRSQAAYSSGHGGNSQSVDGIEVFDGENYSGASWVFTEGNYNNLADFAWYDRIESIRFKGNYARKYHVVLCSEKNLGGDPGHYEEDAATLGNAQKNHVRSIRIYHFPLGSGIELYDGENHSGSWKFFEAGYPEGKTADLNSVSFYDMAESVKFVGECSNERCHAVLFSEKNFTGDPAHYEKDQSTLADAQKNHVRSVNIYFIVPPEPPSNPSPANGEKLGALGSTLDVSFTAGGSDSTIHIWGEEYDQWRDWNQKNGWHLEGLLPGRTYYWQAQARNRIGESPWSPVWCFTTAALPAPNSISPNSAEQGKTITITINGDHLTGVSSLDFSETGIYTSEIIPVSDKQIEATIVIDNDAEPGSRDITLTNHLGVSPVLSEAFNVNIATIRFNSASLNQLYDGTPRAVNVVTNPEGLDYTISYSGSSTPPLEVGIYNVRAEITSPGYTDNVSAFLTIRSEKAPAISIISPLNNSTVGGEFIVRGISVSPDSNYALREVEIKIDHGGWELAAGTDNWHYDWDTTQYKGGQHKIYARSFNGSEYSPEIQITVNDAALTASIFGNGQDGELIIASDTVDNPIDSACNGTQGELVLNASNLDFSPGQVILIHQTQGINAGQYEINTVKQNAGSKLFVQNELKYSYTTGAQVLVLRQYTNVTVASGVTWIAKAWNGTTGGILVFMVNGNLIVNGIINGTGRGFRGGLGANPGYSGEGTQGPGSTRQAHTGGSGGGCGFSTSGGAGGGNGTIGDGIGSMGDNAEGGKEVGTADLTLADLGGGGGGGESGENPGSGGTGGAFIFLSARTISVVGSIVSNGMNGSDGGTKGRAGGGGAGGSILLRANSLILGDLLVNATGGAAGGGVGLHGFAGGTGRIHVDYYDSYNGNTNPELKANKLIQNSISRAAITLNKNDLVQVYDGTPRVVNAITNPPGLNYVISYNGSTTVPGELGIYTVAANITSEGYMGQTFGTLTVTSVEPLSASILTPLNNSTFSGSISIRGTAFSPDVNYPIQKVELKINDGEWVTLEGTTSWMYDWDTTGMADGQHEVFVRSFNGREYSPESMITVTKAVLVSSIFGNGQDGELTISSDTIDNPIDSACSGTQGGFELFATNAGFSSGQIILINQTQHGGAGQYETNAIQDYAEGIITVQNALKYSYSTGAQVLVLKQYSNVIVASGATWSAKAWNGTTGGILAFLVNGDLIVNGTINGTGRGFRGGAGGLRDAVYAGQTGEGSVGPGAWNGGDGVNSSANFDAGQGGYGRPGGGEATGGGGAGHTYAGTNSTRGDCYGGSTSTDVPDLTTMLFGPGGGGGGAAAYHTNPANEGAAGGNGGGILFITAFSLTNYGNIVSNGNNGNNSLYPNFMENGGGGGGAAGSIFLRVGNAVLGNSSITAAGGAGGNGDHPRENGGSGSIGRIHIDYYTSLAGTTDPAFDSEHIFTPVAKQATITLGNQVQNHDGNLKTVSYNTDPAGLDVSILYYQGGLLVEHPVEVGLYDVYANITKPGFWGATFGTLEITKKLVGLTIYPSTLTLTRGQIQQFWAIPEYEDNSSYPYRSVEWSSSEPDKAEIDSDGLVRAVGVSESAITISATSGSIKATATIVINSRPTFEDIPQVAWAGEKIVLEWNVGPAFEGSIVQFTINSGPGILEDDQATSVNYRGIVRSVLTSANQGECRINAGLTYNGELIEEQGFSVYYLEMEKLSLGLVSGNRDSNTGRWTPSNPWDSSIDSLAGNQSPDSDPLLRTRVKGWFTSEASSTREEALIDLDGDGAATVILPAGRWVLPDDWNLLAGSSSTRLHWDIMDSPFDPIMSDNLTGPYLDDQYTPVQGPFSPGIEIMTASGWETGFTSIDMYRDMKTVIPNGEVDYWDAPMPPAKMTFEITAGPGYFKIAKKAEIYYVNEESGDSSPQTSIKYTAPFYRSMIPAHWAIPAFTASGGYSWDSYNQDYGPYKFWDIVNQPYSSAVVPSSDPSYPTIVEVYSDNHGESMVFLNGNWNMDLGDSSKVVAIADYPYVRSLPPVSSNEIDLAWSDFNLSNNSIVENQPANTVVGHFMQTNPDRENTFKYSLVTGTGDNDNLMFNISGDNVQTSVVFDYESKNTYNIRVRCTASSGAWQEKGFSIAITDVNDAPSDILLSNNSVAESQPEDSVVGSFDTIDQDTGNTFTYSLVTGAGSDDNAFFNISADMLRTSAILDYESRHSYNIRIRSTDNVGQWMEKQFNILVTDNLEIATATALSSTPNPADFAQTVVLNAIVTSFEQGGWIPSGTVDFRDGATPLGSGLLNGKNPDTASLTISSFSVGSHQITAVYRGDGNFRSSTSAVVDQVINPNVLTIATISLADGDMGTTYSQSLTAISGKPPYTWSLKSGLLPSGLKLDKSGVISGKPTGATTRVFTVQVTDSAKNKAQVTKKLSIKINPLLKISTTSLPTGLSGVYYSQIMTASGGSGKYSWTLKSGNLPNGLKLTVDGLLSGTTTQSGIYSLLLQVNDGIASVISSKAMGLTIRDPLTITTVSLPDIVFGATYKASLKAGGGSSPYTWSKGAVWPAGFVLSSSGIITGKAKNAGTQTFTVTVTDQEKNKATAVFSIEVHPPVVLTAVGLQAGEVNLPYATWIPSASGGDGHYSWSKTGSLPSGLTFNPNSGAISGTPGNNVNNLTVIVSVTDQSGGSASKVLSLTVYKALQITTKTLKDGKTGSAYSVTLKAQYGSGKYVSWQTIGVLPQGLTLDSTKGVISGKPKIPGTFDFVIYVKDSLGGTCSMSYKLKIK